MEQDLFDLLESAVAETGRELGDSLESIRTYAAEQMAQLALGVGQPGFQEAVQAARDNVALRAALDLTANADAADARIVGILQGALAIGARALARGTA